MRLFIAINLPTSLKEKIADIEEIFKKCGLDAKWVNPKNIHLTLKFLGETNAEKVEEIQKIIKDVTNQFSSIEVTLSDFGFFPNERRPRVFFVSTDKEEILKNIAQKLEEGLEKIGFEKEGRFRSHITLARLKSPKNIGCLMREIKNTTLKEALAINEITLTKSTLTRSGPIYEDIFKAELPPKL